MIKSIKNDTAHRLHQIDQVLQGFLHGIEKKMIQAQQHLDECENSKKELEKAFAALQSLIKVVGK